MPTSRSRLLRGLLRTILALSGLVILCLVRADLAAQQAPAPPTLTYRFDFETDVDRDSLPDYWKLAAGRNDPLSPNGKLVPDDPHHGKLCFEITPVGLTTIYQTTDTFPLDGRFTYHLTGWAKTRDLPSSGLRSSSASIQAVLVNPDGSVIETLLSDKLIGTTDGWQQLSIEISPSPEAKPRSVRIGVVQEGSALTGKVWFDDMVLSATPTIDVTFPRVARLITPDDAPRCHIDLTTLIGNDYHLDVAVIAPDGAKTSKHYSPIVLDRRLRATLAVDLPLHAFGLYTIETQLASDGAEPIRRDLHFGYLPASPNNGVLDRRFGVTLDSSSPRLDAMASSLGVLGMGQALIEIWRPDQLVDSLAREAERLDPILATLRRDNVLPVLVLAGVPQDIGLQMLSAGVAPDETRLTLSRLLTADQKFWLKPLTATAEGFSHRTGCWMLGAQPDLNMSPQDPAIMRNVFNTTLSSLAPRWKIGVPINLRQDAAVIRAAHQLDFVLFKLGPDLPAKDLVRTLAAFKSGRAEQWLDVTLLDESRSGRDAQLSDLVQRVALARSAGISCVVIEPALGGLFDRQADPRDALLVLGTLARELDGLDYLGDLSPRPDVHLLVFSSPTRTAAVFWGDESANWSGYLGSAVKRVDLWGNAAPLTTAEGVAKLKPAKLPFLLTGLDRDRLAIHKPTPEIPTP